MSSSESGPSAFFSKRVYWTVIPLLALAMFVTTAVAGIPGIFLLKDAVGPDRIGYVYVSYGIIAGSTIVLECLFFYTGIYLVWKLTRRIKTLTDEMQTLTRSVLHDISTPVSHIQHKVDLLSDPDADPAAIQADISNSCANILKIVRLSSEISRTYEGLDRSGAEPVDFAAIVREACDIFGAAAEDKGVALACDVPGVPVTLTAHTYRLQRLVGNLIDNAIKFTPAGGRVDVTLGCKGTSAVLKVIDTGIGMTADEQALAFQRFYRADKSRGTPGSGLGLSLVHAIVNFYHGTIAVQSKPNKGTTFTVTLVR